MKRLAPVLSILILLWALPLHAVEQEAVHAEHEHEDIEESTHRTEGEKEHPVEHEAAHTGHGQGHHGHIPLIYYLYWFLLVSTLIAVGAYCIWIYKRGKPHHEGVGLAGLFVLLAITLYAMNQFPDLQRHFDEASHRFVDGYHESAIIGSIKFFYKVLLGVFLMIYGLMGMEHH